MIFIDKLVFCNYDINKKATTNEKGKTGENLRRKAKGPKGASQGQPAAETYWH